MDLPVFTPGSASCSRVPNSSSQKPSLVFVFFFLRTPSFLGAKLGFRSASSAGGRRLRISAASEFGAAERAFSPSDFWSDSDSVEVIGIGSRKDAVLNFCLESPFHSSALRYWNILVKDSMKVQLQQRVLGKDPSPTTFEALPSLVSPSKTIILVASAGYGVDHKLSVDILKAVKSSNGFTVAIILNPFSFEGQRRRNEVKELVEKLKPHTDLFIDLNTDKLLKKDLVTLDEAVRTANNAVLMAIAALSALKSDFNHKIVRSSRNSVKSVDVSEVLRILEGFKEAKLGFGAGYNIQSSILQSIYECPFLSMGFKDLDGMILCILASSDCISETDVDAFLHIFRQTTEYTKEVLLCTVQEPNLEPNLLVTTVLIAGSSFTGQEASQKTGILTRLAQSFPFIRRLFQGDNLQSSDTQGSNGTQRTESSLGRDLPEEIIIRAVDGIGSGSDKYSEKLQTVTSDNNSESGRSSESDRSVGEFFEADIDSSDFQDPIAGEPRAFQREELVGWKSRLGSQIAQKWAKERAMEAGAASTLDKQSIFRLPVGVRPPEEQKDRFNISSPMQYTISKSEDVFKSKPSVGAIAPSLNELTDTGLEAVKDFYNTAAALLKGNSMDSPKKQGILSARAASMLEAERDAPKKWSPTVEMTYRGGIYIGRCQGGLPEGKGRLVLGDGSIYDGIWRYGKRSGSGTLYFSNGDVFQGSWRDDMMHGKGWFYFHTGDRWFSNFWKGKANGEGRFYSKSGDVLFGNFLDGWRHGEFICIDVDGKRRVENWDNGVLMSRSLLDS